MKRGYFLILPVSIIAGSVLLRCGVQETKETATTTVSTSSSSTPTPSSTASSGVSTVLTVSPTSKDYGTLSTTQVFTISNSSSGSVTFGSFTNTVSGFTCGSYSFTLPAKTCTDNGTLGASSSCTISLKPPGTTSSAQSGCVINFSYTDSTGTSRDLSITLSFGVIG